MLKRDDDLKIKFNFKKGQGIIEFFMIFSVIMLFFVVFLLIIQENIYEKNLDKERIIAQEIALSIKSEISLAAESSDGYYREFYVPPTLIGKEYEVILDGKSIYLSADRIGISYDTIAINGNIVKGYNIIQKQNGSVYLNV